MIMVILGYKGTIKDKLIFVTFSYVFVRYFILFFLLYIYRKMIMTDNCKASLLLVFI